MKFAYLVSNVLLLLSGTIHCHGSEPTTDDEKLNADVSLPDLLAIDKLPSNWVAGEDASLEEGRMVLTPNTGARGSLWQRDSYKLKNAFTVEWTFRSVDYAGKSEGGLAFWIITSASSKNDDKKLYDGPSKFDGLQILVDNNGRLSSSVGAQFSDGSTALKKQDIYDISFASCLMGYQESSVPSTARLTYDRESDNLLKLQIDNTVCFQTRKAQIPQGDYKIGVTADNANTPESFEILKMKFYDGVVEDSLIPNVHSMAQPKVFTKVVDENTGEEQLLEKEIFDAQSDKFTNYDLFKKLDRIEGKILANDIHSLEVKLNELMSVQEDMVKFVGQLMIESDSIDPKDNYGDFYSLNEKLEKMLQEQEKVRDATKSSSQNGPHVDEIARRLAVWLLPLIVIMLIMAYYTFRIRQEIVKTKLL
ncbi:ZYBA0S15-01310g1_1 [Zygosaccharomyces bailii CLIB 213]|uniref:ZYBA0S15-01310g1_1 n=1 Tax=Zygosaccharomyces bailii (strain CLIB 213 / ATCC 58445 / CBS 680 / BCRC 21525 / NBRC 1098 / NCYC 1416 / NRRL Y-2227) TaxID=1333698 RepID=A0A8J2TCE7_ZYGB2|nr:ZYBA0S15-01310g1_1 [Zygosaccharomyces bailii CLIB 213]